MMRKDTNEQIEATRPTSAGGSASTFSGVLEAARAAERRGDSAAALQGYEQALLALESTDADARAADILRWIGTIYREQGETDRAEQRYRESLAVAERSGYRAGMAHAVHWLAIIEVHRGRLKDAEASFARARQLAMEAGEVRLEGQIQQKLGVPASVQGDLDAAVMRYRAALDAARGWWEEAEAACRRARMLARRRNDRLREAEMLQTRGALERERNRPERAERYLAEARALAAQCGDRLLQAEIAREIGLLHTRAGRTAEARASLSLSLDLFRGLGATSDCCDVEAKLARIPASP